MAQYINKADLVAEIKKHQAIWDGIDGDYCKGESDAYSDMLSFIDTLEVKEVDINKEISQFIDVYYEKAKTGHKLSLRRTAKHFFELGLTVQKGENQ